jgi:integrase
MQIKVSGLGRATKKDASGKVVKTYWYAWRGKGAPLIADEDGKPIEDPKDPRFEPAFLKAREKMHKKGDGPTMATLIKLYRESSEYLTRGEKTKKSYNAYLKLIEEKFGHMPVEAVEDTGARGEFKEWRDEMAVTPRKADYAWTVLARVLSVAKDRGKIAVNVCERGGRLYEADRSEKIWTADDIKKFGEKASPELQAALMLALWTGQRQGDLLTLTWANYDGQNIRLRQGKSKKTRADGERVGGKRVVIPVGKPLKEALDSLKVLHEAAKAKAPDRKVVPMTILINSYGMSWTEDGFRASWRKTCTKAKIDDLHFHDLRGTAVTRLALAGSTVPQIAAITGHSLKDVEELLDAHYLGGRIELAEAAIMKLNAVYGG